MFSNRVAQSRRNTALLRKQCGPVQTDAHPRLRPCGEVVSTARSGAFSPRARPDAGKYPVADPHHLPMKITHTDLPRWIDARYLPGRYTLLMALSPSSSGTHEDPVRPRASIGNPPALPPAARGLCRRLSSTLNSSRAYRFADQ